MSQKLLEFLSKCTPGKPPRRIGLVILNMQHGGAERQFAGKLVQQGLEARVFGLRRLGRGSTSGPISSEFANVPVAVCEPHIVQTLRELTERFKPASGNKGNAPPETTSARNGGITDVQGAHPTGDTPVYFIFSRLNLLFC